MYNDILFGQDNDSLRENKEKQQNQYCLQLEKYPE